MKLKPIARSDTLPRDSPRQFSRENSILKNSPLRQTVKLTIVSVWSSCKDNKERKIKCVKCSETISISFVWRKVLLNTRNNKDYNSVIKHDNIFWSRLVKFKSMGSTDSKTNWCVTYLIVKLKKICIFNFVW